MHSRGDSEKRHHVPSVPEIMCSLTCTLPVLNDQSSSKIVTVYNAKRSIDHCIRCQCPPNFSPGDRTGARTRIRSRCRPGCLVRRGAQTRDAQGH